jgi:hypothetical protein
MGNPAKQKYIIRWLFYFPIPTVLRFYNFETDYICFYSDYIYNFYKHVCISCKIPDLLTKNIKKLNICRVFKFEPEIYKSFQNNRLINRDYNTNKKCFTVRKLFPPASFNSFYKFTNISYAREIIIKHKNEINLLKNQINRLNNNFLYRNALINKLHKKQQNQPKLLSHDGLREFITNKFISNGYEHIEHRNSSIEYIQYFQNKDYFLSFDPFTFISIIASLCGCTSVIKKIDSLTFNEWVNGDPFNKYGIAYGHDGIQYALETQHLLFQHITEMYNENTNNIINFLNSIENKFSIKINKI